MTALRVFNQNNGDVTRAYYEKLAATGPLGRIAVALFRAQKRSSRAKDYKRGRFRRAAYDVKSWSLGEVCKELAANGSHLGFVYGWKEDPEVLFGERASWVLYVDIPKYGQVSFHSPDRGEGPDYPGEWDHQKEVCAARIIQFCDAVMTEAECAAK